MQEPIRMRVVDSMIEKLAPHLPKEDQESLRARKGTYDNEDATNKRRAQELEINIRDTGKANLLHVGMGRWSEEQSRNFIGGTEYYKGRARQVYCSRAGRCKNPYG
uniref:Uncharacterized protein n=1 Tax=Guillardia theta TaxID=55529 RepID=A0A7S4NZ81_GUITH|mmetsp:Transcript_38348/g.120742  ORF Transcript_38348/g.120742 Transcript_38348/m.120742 type:complete len:106 (+) Transcript_38348:293-610(+)